MSLWKLKQVSNIWHFSPKFEIFLELPIFGDASYGFSIKAKFSKIVPRLRIFGSLHPNSKRTVFCWKLKKVHFRPLQFVQIDAFYPALEKGESFAYFAVLGAPGHCIILKLIISTHFWEILSKTIRERI